MDLTSMIEMSTLNYNKDTTKPAQASNSSVSPSTIPLQTSATTLAPASTPNYEPHSVSNPFTLPFQTLIVRSHTSAQTVKLFVRISTLYRAPFFAQKLNSGELRNDEDFYMVDELDDADSLGLLFSLIQDQVVPDLVGHDVDVGGNEERVSAYVRAYPIAGKLGLEEIQNQIVDRLVAHYLEHPVLATDIGILIRAGVAKSKFGTLLMRELARGMIDGIYRANLQERDIESEEIIEHHDHGIEDARKSDDGTMIGASSHSNQVSNDKEHVFRPRPSAPPRTNLQQPVQSSDMKHIVTNTKSVATPLTGDGVEPSTATTNATIDLSTEDNVLEQIQKFWTMRDATTLMAMVIEAHEDAKDPTNRSPLEIAAAEPCKIHVHTITDTCPKQKLDTGHKRKRAVSAWDVSDNEESEDDCDEEDDSSSVHSSSSEMIEVHSVITRSDKENSGPDGGSSAGAKKEGATNEKASGPQKKRRKLGWLFG